MVEHVIAAVPGVAGVVTHEGETVGDIVPGAGGVVQGAVNKALQCVQLPAQAFDGVPARVDKYTWLRLPCNAAHVLAAQDRTKVGAAGDIAAAAAHHAAGVVAHVGIPHCAVVGAVENLAAGIPGDAAGVGIAAEKVVGFVVRGGLLLDDGTGVGGAEVHGGAALGEVDAGVVGAEADQA